MGMFAQKRWEKDTCGIKNTNGLICIDAWENAVDSILDAFGCCHVDMACSQKELVVRDSKYVALVVRFIVA